MNCNECKANRVASVPVYEMDIAIAKLKKTIFRLTVALAVVSALLICVIVRGV